MVQDYADLRWFSTIPITQHISLPYVYQGQRVHDAANLIANRAVDGFNFNAGLGKFKQLDAIASAANLFCFHGRSEELRVGKKCVSTVKFRGWPFQKKKK